MLTKADRNTRVMVNTPTRVLFILERTIFLERVCRGAGKSCGGGRTEQNSLGTPRSAIEPALPSTLVSRQCQHRPRALPEHPPHVQASSLIPLHQIVAQQHRFCSWPGLGLPEELTGKRLDGRKKEKCRLDLTREVDKAHVPAV